MTLNAKKHVLICLEESHYSRKILLRGALLAKEYGYTFEIVFFMSIKCKDTIFHFLNIAESNHLSKKLGATKFTLKKTKNEKDTIKKIAAFAKDNKITEIVMSGTQNKSSSKYSFLRHIFFIDKYDYISKKNPHINLILINYRGCNPFKNGEYHNGKKGYLIKGHQGKISYVLSDKPSHEKYINGLFFQRKDMEEMNGLFACFRNGRLVYIHIRKGRISF